MLQKSRDFLGKITRSLILGLLAFALTCGRPTVARAEDSNSHMTGTLKAFVLTSTYGVIAGGLTGLASLAFYPGHASEHTRNIAMGASIGLYTGILLGAYIVYGPMLNKPDTSSPQQEKEKPENPDDPINLGADAGYHVAPTLSYLPQTGVQLGVVYNF